MMYALLTSYTCLAVSLAAMAVVMIVNGDPDASVGLAVGFGLFALVFVTLAAALYRPLLHQGSASRSNAEGPSPLPPSRGLIDGVRVSQRRVPR
ncbi:hypothetical protein GA0070624_5431 [Micromonospora rhizosphaerae]|uniref:Uncharacterized protein n=1 Tax=Micromonospora rhizosphaerae TaxID=568872 RepID=A0A1C6T2L3_9ACTN|nr:hypothetical protein [Micromonospora rhizosphaerae]SCL36008.1 hypothetical protein GA0070624_5431 [Micromonospora rhizosphaerae]